MQEDLLQTCSSEAHPAEGGESDDGCGIWDDSRESPAQVRERPGETGGGANEEKRALLPQGKCRRDQHAECDRCEDGGANVSLDCLGISLGMRSGHERRGDRRDEGGEPEGRGEDLIHYSLCNVTYGENGVARYGKDGCEET